MVRPTTVAVGGAVVAVAGLRIAHCDHESGVGADGDLNVGRVPIVLAPGRQAVIPRGNQGAVHDRDLIDGSVFDGRQRQQRTEGVDHPVRGRMRDPNSGPICRIVRFVRQYVATSRTRSANPNAHCRPGRPSAIALRTTSSNRTSFRNCRGVNPVNGPIHSGHDAEIIRTQP